MKKTVLITGASRGIGRAIAIEFARMGYNLVITCKENGALLTETYKEISMYPVDCDCFIGNLGNQVITKELFSKLTAKNICIDILINNAGISYYGLLQEMELQTWHEVMDSNVTSVFLMSKEVIPNMIKNKSGKIINISSVWGLVGASFEVAYSASKGALNSFTKSLAKELAPSNIQVNAVACGLIDTTMNSSLSKTELKTLEESIPLGRMGKASEVAALVLTLAQSNDYLTGQIITLDGGWT